MPGSSLWLVPPPSHPLHDILTELITKTIPSLFPGEAPPSFAPHLTLTSEIPPTVYGDQPQQWLDSIPWPAQSQVLVRFDLVKTEDVFFRRCYLKAGLEGVAEIVSLARARGVNNEQTPGIKTQQWLENWVASFGPHVSLAYGNFNISDDKLEEVTRVVANSEIKLGGSKPGAVDGVQNQGGWQGGVVWFVPTDRPIAEWKPIATRELK